MTLAFFASSARAETEIAQTGPTPTPTPSATPTKAAVPGPMAPSATPSATPAPSSTPLKVVTWSGFFDASYEHFNYQPVVSNTQVVTTSLFSNTQATTRIFDTYQDRFNLNDLNIQLNLNTEPVGAKVEAIFGSDANVVASGGTNATDSFDLVQSYLTANVGAFNLIVGRYETLAGAEVIESPSSSDFNFSRSYQFGYAVPFTHTGARLTYAQPSGKYSIIFGLNNGWDEMRFLGQGLTIEGGMSINISPAIVLIAQTYNGLTYLVPPPAPVTITGNRMLYDAVLTVHATPALTLVTNYDNGTQLNLNGAIPSGSANAHWAAISGYAQYQFSPLFYAALRGEVFDDKDGYRTPFGTPLTYLRSGTLTLGYSPNSHLLFRLEGRIDGVNGPSIPTLAGFQQTAAVFQNAQSTVGAEVIGKF